MRGEGRGWIDDCVAGTRRAIALLCRNQGCGESPNAGSRVEVPSRLDAAVRVDREEMIRMELAARDLHAFQENRVGPRSELGLSAICTEGTTRQVPRQIGASRKTLSCRL